MLHLAESQTVKYRPKSLVGRPQVSGLGQRIRREMTRIQAAHEPPLRAWGRFLTRVDYVNEKLADYIRMHWPVTHLLEEEIMYRRIYWKNYEVQISGETGSGKSLGGIELATKLDPKWRIGKMFFSDEGLKTYAQTEMKPGDCLVKDEDLRRFGSGSMFASKTRENIEGTVRWDQICFIFIYTLERFHIVHLHLYSRKEHYIAPARADYFVYGAEVPVTGVDTNVGLLTLDVPSQRLIKRYNVRKKEFVRTMAETGGTGETFDILKAYEWVKDKLKNDTTFHRFERIGSQVTYISHKFGLTKELSRMFLELHGDELYD